MNLSGPIKAVSVLAGAFVALAAVSAFAALNYGDFEQGRTFTLLSGVFLLLLSASLLSAPFRPRFSKCVGVVAMLFLALAMAFAVFTPGLASKDPAFYQVAAISLVVLLVARVALSFRRVRAGTDA